MKGELDRGEKHIMLSLMQEIYSARCVTIDRRELRGWQRLRNWENGMGTTEWGREGQVVEYIRAEMEGFSCISGTPVSFNGPASSSA